MEKYQFYHPPSDMKGEIGGCSIRFWVRVVGQRHDQYAQRCISIHKGGEKLLEVAMTFGGEDPETKKLKLWIETYLPQFKDEDGLYDAVCEENAKVYYASLEREANRRGLSIEEVAMEWDDLEEAAGRMGDMSA